jgi:hypothetical protein
MWDRLRLILVIVIALPVTAAQAAPPFDPVASIRMWMFPLCQPVRMNRLTNKGVHIKYEYLYSAPPPGCIRLSGRCVQRGWCISDIDDSGPLIPRKLDPNGCQQLACADWGKSWFGGSR